MMGSTTRGNTFAVDAQGEVILLSSRGQQVMMQWERVYMERCVDALKIQQSDGVLEIGFGLAYSATHIQTFHPQHHTIIECDLAVLERAQAFASQRQGVEIIDGTWQSLLPKLGAFDCVFFDDYPLPELEEEPADALSHGTSVRRSRWHDFLDVVLHHVRPGARITGYLARPIDLMREGCVVEMTSMQVLTSASCTYYPHREAYVAIITVVDPALAQVSTRHLQRERLDRVREQLVVQSMVDDLQGGNNGVEGEAGDDVNDTHLSNSGVPLPADSMADMYKSEESGALYAGFPSRKAYLASLRSRRGKPSITSTHA